MSVRRAKRGSSDTDIHSSTFDLPQPIDSSPLHVGLETFTLPKHSPATKRIAHKSLLANAQCLSCGTADFYRPLAPFDQRLSQINKMTKPNQSEVSPGDEFTSRRTAFKRGMAALFALAMVRQAAGAEAALAVNTMEPSDMGTKMSSDSGKKNSSNSAQMLDRVAIGDVIMRERWARETKNAEVAAACFHPDAWVEVSWFKGTAAEFVESGKRKPPADTVNFDSMSPPVIWIRNDRAIADTACAVHTFLRLDGIEVSTISYTRLLWRAQVLNGQWLIAGLRGIYIRDTLEPSSPDLVLKLDEKKLDRYRPSYRHLSYVLEAGGRPAHDDLPGIDRPETVAALRAGESQWLEQA